MNINAQLNSYQKRKKVIKQIIFWSIIIGAILAMFVPTVVKAQEPINPCETGLFCVGGITDNSDYNTGSIGQNISNFIGAAANILVFVIASVSVIYLILAAWEMMNAGGDSSKFEKGAKGIKNALIGLVVAILSFTIVQIVINIIANINI